MLCQGYFQRGTVPQTDDRIVSCTSRMMLVLSACLQTCVIWALGAENSLVDYEGT
jgi:hypothetical protein